MANGQCIDLTGTWCEEGFVVDGRCTSFNYVSLERQDSGFSGHMGSGCCEQVNANVQSVDLEGTSVTITSEPFLPGGDCVGETWTLNLTKDGEALSGSGTTGQNGNCNVEFVRISNLPNQVVDF